MLEQIYNQFRLFVYRTEYTYRKSQNRITPTHRIELSRHENIWIPFMEDIDAKQTNFVVEKDK